MKSAKIEVLGEIWKSNANGQVYNVGGIDPKDEEAENWELFEQAQNKLTEIIKGTGLPSNTAPENVEDALTKLLKGIDYIKISLSPIFFWGWQTAKGRRKGASCTTSLGRTIRRARPHPRKTRPARNSTGRAASNRGAASGRSRGRSKAFPAFSYPGGTEAMREPARPGTNFSSKTKTLYSKVKQYHL